MANYKGNALSWRERLGRLSLITQVAVLALAGLVPLMFVNQASAAQITDRVVTIDDSRTNASSNADVEYAFSFDWSPASAVQSVILEFCDSPLPLSSCTTPAGMLVNPTAITVDSHTGFPTNATSFTEVTTNSGDCNTVTADDATTEQICMNRTEAASATGDDATITVSGITNPTSIDTVYIRINLYSDNAFSTQVHAGTVAAAIVDQLTISGRVQERLDFCVAAVDDAGAADTGQLPADVTTCSALTDQNVDIGIIDESAVAVSPVDGTATNGADDDIGILMVNTNASNGTTLSYYVEDPTAVLAGDTHQLKSFRVIPADCDATATLTTDQCFVSADGVGTGSVITAGSELFGVYIPCIDTSQQVVPNSSANIVADGNYNGNDDTTTSAVDCENEAFASTVAVVGWNSGLTADTLATSATTIEDEIVKLRFAATASATTPSGDYTVVTTYIATANF